MFHLFNSVVRVERLQLVVTDGVASMDWVQATDPDDPQADAMLKYLRCRLDMIFLRPGKDIAPAPEAGKAPDRIGVMFTFPYAPIKAGDRFVAIPNDEGKIPVDGTFEIRLKPDGAVGYADLHHLEVQVIEASPNVSLDDWPTEEPLEDDASEEPLP